MAKSEKVVMNGLGQSEDCENIPVKRGVRSRMPLEAVSDDAVLESSLAAAFLPTHTQRAKLSEGERPDEVSGAPGALEGLRSHEEAEQTPGSWPTTYGRSSDK